MTVVLDYMQLYQPQPVFANRNMASVNAIECWLPWLRVTRPGCCLFWFV